MLFTCAQNSSITIESFITFTPIASLQVHTSGILDAISDKVFVVAFINICYMECTYGI